MLYENEKNKPSLRNKSEMTAKVCSLGMLSHALSKFTNSVQIDSNAVDSGVLKAASHN